MARPKEFDENEALDKAMRVFWRTGYSATSMQDLIDAMAINRQSLYDTFGDKQALFLAVMQHYTRNDGSRWIRPLFDTDDLRIGVRRALQNIVDESMTEPRELGCLLVNTAVECPPLASEVSDCLRQAMMETEQCFYNAFSAAQERGQLNPDLNAKALAAYFLNSVRGLRVMARLRPERAELEDIFNVTLSVLG